MTEPFPPMDGADVPAPRPAPGASWAPPAAPGGAHLPPSGSEPTTATPMVAVSNEPPKGRSRGKVVGAAVGVTALLAAGAFAVVSISGNDDSGGAGSPTEVGTQLTAALDNEDVLGVVDLLLPGERETFRDPIIRTVENLKRLEVLSDEASLDGIAGIDLQFSDVSVREEQTNVDDIVNIYLSGSATASVDGDEVPIGDLLLDEAFGGDRPEVPGEPETSEFEDTKMTVVQRDGRWYLSAFYSVAEAARGDADIPDAGVAPAGADEPELAVDQMLSAIGDQDLEGLIAILDPNEAEALQRYAPLFLDQGQDAIDSLDVDWSIDDTAFEVEGSGDRRTVDITAFTFTVNDPTGNGEDVVVVFADGCATVTLNGEDTQSCGVGDGGLGDLGDLVDDADLGDDGAISDLLDSLGAAFDDYEASGLGVHQVDGIWYVSPLSTVFDAWNDVLDALDRDELTDLITQLEDIGGIDDISDIPGMVEDETGLSVDEPADQPDASIPTISLPTDNSVPSDDSIPSADEPTVDTVDADAIGQCYQAATPAEGIVCMNEGIAAGTIDPDYVAVPVRFPDCGAAEAYWGEVYTMDDAAFTAMVTAASPCFIELVASGQLDKYSVPSEFYDPACLEGRNWYTADDDEYLERFFSCSSEAAEAL
jgi:hypothetical protein